MEDNHINEEDAVLEEGIVRIEEETVTEEVRETAGEDAARQPAGKKEKPKEKERKELTPAEAQRRKKMLVYPLLFLEGIPLVCFLLVIQQSLFFGERHVDIESLLLFLFLSTRRRSENQPHGTREHEKHQRIHHKSGAFAFLFLTQRLPVL